MILFNNIRPYDFRVSRIKPPAFQMSCVFLDAFVQGIISIPNTEGGVSRLNVDKSRQ